MGEAISWVVGFLLPPKGQLDSELYWWALRLAFTTMGVVMTLGFYGAAALGFLPAIIFSGFATASSVSALQAQIHSDVEETRKQTHLEVGAAQAQMLTIQLGQLDDKIVATRGKQCKAMSEHNEEAKAFAEERLQYQIQTYYKLTGFAYRIPDCSEL